ncbi:hypothetical protein ACHAWX_004423 [Stephanocyclus meneghinianus]
MTSASTSATQPLSASSGRHDERDASDSDEDDVAFAYMNFQGVDFGEVTCRTGTKEDMPVVEDGDDVGEVSIAKDLESNRNDRPSSLIVTGAGSSVECSDPHHVHYVNRQKKDLSSVFITPDMQLELSSADKELSSLEQHLLLPRLEDESYGELDDFNEAGSNDAQDLFRLLKQGAYADMLRSSVAFTLFGDENEPNLVRFPLNLNGAPFMMERIKMRAFNYCSSKDISNKSTFAKCLELELIGIASLNLFLQLNYTGPSLDRGLKPEEGKEHTHPFDGIHPHGIFQTMAKNSVHNDKNVRDVTVSTSFTSVSEDGPSSGTLELSSLHSLKENTTTDAFHNAVLSELAIDGELPFQICRAPYFLLLARSILSMLAEPTRPFRIWTDENGSEQDDVSSTYSNVSYVCDAFPAAANFLFGAALWSARAVVAHRRLITVRRDDDDGSACPTLWKEAEEMFQRCLGLFCKRKGFFADNSRNTHVAGSVMLEWGLAQHHFRKIGRGKASFNKALDFVELEVEVTGAEGKRTKYQKKSTAQYLVRAKHAEALVHSDYYASEGTQPVTDKNAHIEAQMIKHDDVSDDALLLEKIKFEEEQDNIHYRLSILDQSILLALCLDVKNDNPMDGLTGEQMGGFLARVLNQHDDWMVYATALLERAWLECERTHGRERAILQIQALADQHSNRLTLTQSTFKAVEEDSAPAQDRLRNLHGIVYPPRWELLRDLAERYAKLGVVTSAAELFEELELWDEVVECYRIAGKESKAEEVVRKRLAVKETPRMYAALGDLTKDPKYFERALELSHGKFYDAYVALGKYHFDRGDLRVAMKHYRDALGTKPLMPAVWFKVGTIGMQLREWDTALRAFTEVVQQQPDEGDAWANVAAIHMYRRNPAEAYPALLESLKQNRNNWRVWVSKLYTCIDLKKYDEAIQACNELLTLKARRNESEKVPMIEEKCVRAILCGSIRNYDEARSSCNDCSIDSSRRTLVRLRELLDRMQESTKSEIWLYEVSAHLNSEIGLNEDILSDLMREYRAMQSEKWEQEQTKVTKMVNLTKDIFRCHMKDGTVESLSKCKLMLNGVKKKIGDNCCETEPPKEIIQLESMVTELDQCISAAKAK